MISDHVNRCARTFQVVLPHPESIKNVMGVIVLFGRSEGTGMESDRVDITGVGDDGEDSTKCIVRSIHLNDQGLIRLPVHKNRSGGEGSLQSIEGLPCFICEIPLSPHMGQAG